MALSRIKTWIAEVLTHTDLNAEFNNLINYLNGSGVTLTSPAFSGTATGAAATWTGTSTLAAAKTASGVTASTATATPVTIYTPAGSASALFLVWMNVSGFAGGGFSSWAAVIYDTATSPTVTRIGGNNGTTSSITTSGSNIQVTQSSGGNLVMEWCVFRIGA